MRRTANPITYNPVPVHSPPSLGPISPTPGNPEPIEVLRKRSQSQSGASPSVGAEGLQIVRLIGSALAAGAKTQHDLRMPCSGDIYAFGVFVTDGVCLESDMTIDFENFAGFQSFEMYALEIMKDLSEANSRFPITGFGWFPNGHVISANITNNNAAAEMDYVVVAYIRPSSPAGGG